MQKNDNGYWKCPNCGSTIFAPSYQCYNDHCSYSLSIEEQSIVRAKVVTHKDSWSGKLDNIIERLERLERMQLNVHPWCNMDNES